ncbi:hypothetical protein [Paenibacillus sp. O199]|uniref:hypothetical protein n=1 Tax=Paenibacillus sp. O199 TaxID=1643925 RepID=UPI0007BF88F5|nr:hypothetical protein [Paenibacillus sp. O199]
MLLNELKIKILITNYNIKYYNNLGYKCQAGEEINIPQSDLPTASRVKVKCKCDNCHKEFERKRIDVKDVTLCDRNCRNKYLKLHNPNPSKEKIKVQCASCKKEVFVHESKYKKQEYFLCSRECYKLHRSENYHSDRLYNYQSTTRNCANCQKEIKVIAYDLIHRNNSFCTTSCYHTHKKNNFSKYYFNDALNKSRKETKPEKAVREYLERNKIEHEQEFCINNMYFADFLIKDTNDIIEVYGDYWHCNPLRYPYDSEKNEIQKKNIRRDKKRNAHLKHLGYNVYIIWERDALNNIDYFMGEIINKIVNKQESATTTRQSPFTKEQDIV